MNMTYSAPAKDKHCLFSLPNKELSSMIIDAPPNDPQLAKDILTIMGKGKIYPQQYGARV